MLESLASYVWGEAPQGPPDCLVERIHVDKKSLLVALRACNHETEHLRSERSRMTVRHQREVAAMAARIADQEAQHSMLLKQLDDIRERERTECERFVECAASSIREGDFDETADNKHRNDSTEPVRI